MSSRRSFIKSSSLIFAGANLYSPASLFAATTAKKEKLGVALVGLGYYSTDLLAPALQLTKHCELKGIVSGSSEKIIAWQKKYNLKPANCYSYDNFDSIANNPEIDIVYVVLPPSMHREYVVRAAKAGKQVWCEKPMAPSVADCNAMIKACSDNKVKLAIGYRCQHDPNIQAYQAITKEKKYGKVRMINSAAGYFDGRSTHWKQKKALGGGVMGDMGVYALQGARLATGEEPISVIAQASTTRPEIYHEVEETIMFQLEFPSGARAACQSSYGINMNYLHINYEKGGVLMEPQSAYIGINGKTTDGLIINYKIENQQAKQMDEDALALINNTTLLVPGEEGLRDITVVEAIYKSVETKTLVRI